MVFSAIHCSTRLLGKSHLPVTLVAGRFFFPGQPVVRGAELDAVGLDDFVEAEDLLDLQLGHLLRPGPDHRPAARVGLLGKLAGTLDAAAEHLLQHADDEVEGVVVVVVHDDVVRRDVPRPGFLFGLGAGAHGAASFAWDKGWE